MDTETSSLLEKKNNYKQSNLHNNIKNSILSCNRCILVNLVSGIVLGVALGLVVVLLLFTSSEVHSPYGTYKHAAVTSDEQRCSQIGTSILMDGGSAVDSAIATSVCIGLYSCQASGIGGGSYMVIYERPRDGIQKELIALDFRETSPLNVNTSIYVNNSHSKGGFSISVPSEVIGYWTAWKKYGRLPWERLFQPSIDLCENGFIISNYLARKIKSTSKKSPPKSCQPSGTIRDILYKNDGTLYQEGELMKRPELAKTLTRIAKDGGDSFYMGSLANDVVEDIKELGGIVTLQDLKSYKPIWRKPLTFNLTSTNDNSNITLAAMSSATGGPVLNLILNIMDGYQDKDDQVLNYHRLIEAFKFAYAMKTRLGDPSFVDISIAMKNMTSKSFAADIRNKIDDSRTHGIPYYNPAGFPSQDEGTSQISVLSPEGGGVSLTSSVNARFGSECKGPRTGIIFNDDIDDFTFQGSNFWYPNSTNVIEPGKRPLSSMVPTLLFDDIGSLRGVIGAAGGTKITTTVAHVLWLHLYQGMPLNEAIDYPRLHHGLIPDELKYERGFPEDILDGLLKKGHVTDETDSMSSYCNPIDITYSDKRITQITAVSDKRKDGKPDGY